MKFFLKILFFINILIFFYALFKSEIVHGGTSRETYLAYYFINAIFLITILLAIIYNRKINNKLILTIIFSCVFSFYLAEGYISYFNFSDNHEVNKIDFDKRSKFQIYSDLKKIIQMLLWQSEAQLIFQRSKIYSPYLV